MPSNGTPVYGINDDGQMDFYFWLGIDGEIEPVADEETFNQKIEHERQNLDDWLNVRTF